MDIQFPEHLPVQEESDVTQPAQPTRRQLDLTAQATQQPETVNRTKETTVTEPVQQMENCAEKDELN